MTALDERTTIRHDWRTDAACRTAPNPAIFFPHRSNTPDARTAVGYCHTCPVRAACLDDARTAGRTSGIWAGLYWDDGRDRAVTDPPPIATSDRITLARMRRRDALAYWHRARLRLHSDGDANRAVAEHYGVTADTAKTWIKRARVEAAADLHATDTDTTGRR